MNKTLLSHFTINTRHQNPQTEKEMQTDSVSDLVHELEHVLKKAETELLSPRPQAIEQLLKEALN